jgi:hypothetical protein
MKIPPVKNDMIQVKMNYSKQDFKEKMIFSCCGAINHKSKLKNYFLMLSGPDLFFIFLV